MRGRTYDRPIKGEVRRTSFETLRELSDQPHAPYASILTLPSREALCVKELVRIGLVEDHTVQQWVENDSRKRRYLNLAASAYPNAEVHFCDLEDHVLTKPVDLVNADMESTVTERLGNWFERQVGPSLIPGADLVLTVTRHARNNPLHAWMLEHLDDSIIAEQVKRLRVRVGSDYEPFVIPLALMHCALQIKTVENIRVFGYADDGHTQMATILMHNIHRVGCPCKGCRQRGPQDFVQWPLFSELVETCDLHRSERGERTNGDTQDRLDRIQMELAAEFKYAEPNETGWTVFMSKIKGVVTEIGRYETLEQIAHQFQIQLQS